MATKGDRVICSVNGKEVLSFTKGIRLVTDGNGKIIEAIGISTKDQKASIEFSGKTFSLTVTPNTVYRFGNNKFRESKKVEFYRPDSF
jgi:peroxiredoxin